MTDTPSAPPGLPQAPMVNTGDLEIGDVVQIAVQLIDQQTRQPYWWKRFAVVTQLVGQRAFYALTLKLDPNMDRDHRLITFSTDEQDRPQVVTKLREPWPQGVAAMHMKLLAKGIIKIERR